MSEFINIRNYIVDYKKYNISITAEKEITISKHKLSVLNVVLTKKNNIKIYLSFFYAFLPKILNKKDEELLAKTLIDNIDNIIFNKNRYIGNFTNNKINDEDIIELLKQKFNNPLEDELSKIYTEFLSIDKNKDKIKYRDYASFLEFYLYGYSNIPDAIRLIFLNLNNKKILDYDNLDNEIRKDFSGNTYGSNEKEINNKKELLNKLLNEREDIEKYLNSLTKYLESSNVLIKISNDISNIITDVNKIQNSIKKSIFLFSKKRKLKKILINKQDNIKILLKTEMEGLSLLKKDIINEFSYLEKIISKLTAEELREELMKLVTKLDVKKNNIAKKEENINNELKILISEELNLDYFFERLNK